MIREPENRDLRELLRDLLGIDPGNVDDDEVGLGDGVRRDQLVPGAEESLELATEEEIDPSNQDRRHGPVSLPSRSESGPTNVSRGPRDRVGSAYERGVELVERGEYFAAHEALEEAWRAAEPGERDFFQGLVHVAVAWYQAGRRNQVGCERQLEKASRRLSPYRPTHRALDVASLLSQLERARGDYPVLAPVAIRRVVPSQMPGERGKAPRRRQ